MTGTTKKATISLLKRHSVRTKQRTREQLIALAESYQAMPIHPIVVRPDMTVADGLGRLDGLELLGVKEVEVFVTDEELTDEALEEIAFVTAFHRTGLTPYDQAQIVIRKRKGGMPNQEVARKLGIDPGYGTKLNSLSECPPADQERARLGKLTAAQWYAIALAQRDKPGKEPSESDTKKQDTVKIVLTEATIKVTGKSLSLASVVKLLGEAEREAKVAIKDNQSARTFEKVMKDRAAKPKAEAGA